MALGKARHLVEHHGRVAHPPHVDVDNAADLLLGLGALDDLELARGFDAFDPVPQILVGHVALPVCWEVVLAILEGDRPLCRPPIAGRIPNRLSITCGDLMSAALETIT